MSRIHPRSLRLKERQEWATSQFLFHPRKNATITYDENAKAALRHYFYSQNILIAFGPGSIKHSPGKVAIQIYYYSPPFSKSTNKINVPNLPSFFAKTQNSAVPSDTSSFSISFTGKRTLESRADTNSAEAKIPNEKEVHEKEITRVSPLPANSKARTMAQLLADLYKKQVDLSLIRLNYPFLNSYILAQYIALNSVRYSVSRIIRSLFKKVPITTITSNDPLTKRPMLNTPISQGKGISGPVSPLQWSKLVRAGDKLIPTHIAGIRIQVSGRMGSKKGASRTTMLSKSLGSFRFNSMTKSMIDYSKVQGKNKNGSFTVKVWISSACTNPC